MKTYLFFLTLMCAPSVVWGEDAVSGSRLGSLDGADELRVVSGVNGENTRVIHRGDELKTGDRIQTTKETLSIVLPGGSVLVVGPNSSLTIQDSPNAKSALDFHAGTLHAIVAKNFGKTDPKKLRLMIRTHSLVMGVRGTDFVVEAEEGTQNATVHTMEGTIEAAKDEETIVEKEGTPVHGGEFLKADASGLSTPEVFDQTRYIQDVKEKTGIEITKPAPTTEASAPSTTEAPKPLSRSSLWSFSAFAGSYDFSDYSLTNPWTVGIAWNPMLSLWGNWLALRGDISVAFVTAPASLTGFTSVVSLPGANIMATFGPLLNLHFKFGFFEGGPALQYWPTLYSQLTTAFIFGTGYEFPLGREGFFRYLDRIYLRAVVTPRLSVQGTYTTTALAAGIGFRI